MKRFAILYFGQFGEFSRRQGMNYDERYILICEAIETALQKGRRDFIIYPFGMNGMMAKTILNERYLFKKSIFWTTSYARSVPT